MKIWKPIPGYDGYEVSENGEVRSYKTNKGRGNWVIVDTPQKTLSQSVSGGYCQVLLSRNGEVHLWRVHRLVLLAFVGPLPKGQESCHNDGNSFNNHISNLRYDSRNSNMEDAKRHGARFGQRNFSPEEVVEIRQQRANGEMIVDLATRYGCASTIIQKMCSGKTYKKEAGPVTKGAPHPGKKAIRGTSRYRGVHWRKKERKWRAQIWVGGRGGRSINLGDFDNQEDAARAYDKAAIKERGKFAQLNFPNRTRNHI